MALITLFRATPGTLEPLVETVNLCKGFFDGVFRMATKNEIKSGLTKEELCRQLDYNPDTGILLRKVSMSNRVKVGDIAGWVYETPRGKKYIRLYVNGVKHLAHRVIFFMMEGKWPDHELDHQNGSGIDNKWDNLKPASKTENLKNKRKRSDNSSGHNGVCWCSRVSKWGAQIGVNGKQKHLGYFKDKEEAIAARKKAEIEYGYHKNHGSDRPL